MPRRVMTDADRQMVQALATVVAADRLSRQIIDTQWVDPTGKGRTRTLRDPEQMDPTPAEQKWMELQAHFGSGQAQWKTQTAPTQEGSEDDPDIPA